MANDEWWLAHARCHAFVILHSAFGIHAAPLPRVRTRRNPSVRIRRRGSKNWLMMARWEEEQLTRQLEWALGLAEKDVKITKEEKGGDREGRGALIEAAIKHGGRATSNRCGFTS